MCVGRGFFPAVPQDLHPAGCLGLTWVISGLGSGLSECLREASVSLRRSASGGPKKSNPGREVNSRVVRPGQLSDLPTRKATYLPEVWTAIAPPATRTVSGTLPAATLAGTGSRHQSPVASVPLLSSRTYFMSSSLLSFFPKFSSFRWYPKRKQISFQLLLTACYWVPFS